MSKNVTSVSIDEDLHDRLKSDKHVNASGLFNQFLREYYAAGGNVDGLQLRLQRVENQIAEKEAELEKLRERRETLKDQIEEREEEMQPEIESSVDTLQSIPSQDLHKENPAVINHAQKLNMQPSELVERVRAY